MCLFPVSYAHTIDELTPGEKIYSLLRAPCQTQKGGILYSRCPSSETRHLARQVGGASTDFFFIDLESISTIFVKLCVALFIRD